MFGGIENPSNYTSRLDVLLLDLDRDSNISRVMTDAIANHPNPNCNWQVQSQGDRSTIQDMINDGVFWAGVVVNSGSFAHLNSCLTEVETSTSNNTSSCSTYSSNTVIDLFYDEARNTFSVNNFLLPPIVAIITEANVALRSQIKTRLLQSSSSSLTAFQTLVSYPSILSPIGYTRHNMHPATPYLFTVSSTLGFIFMWILMGASIRSGMEIVHPLHDKFKIHTIVLLRVAYTIINSFMLSLIFSLIILWFGHISSGETFIRYWFFNWLSMAVFGHIIALFTINLGNIAQILLTLFLVLSIATSTQQIDTALLPNFYRIGWGLPLLHCMQGARNILMGGHSNISLNVGILVLYYVVTLVINIWTAIKSAKQANHEQQKQQKHETITSSQANQPQSIPTHQSTEQPHVNTQHGDNDNDNGNDNDKDNDVGEKTIDKAPLDVPVIFHH